MKLNRTTMVVTQRCTLKCKLCLAFMPYYDNPEDMKWDDFETAIDNYFKIVDQVGIFSITGGEPLMHKDIVSMMEKVFEYRDRIEGYIDIVTNGTINMSNELLDVLEANKDKARVIISNYGKNLSRNIDSIINGLKDRNILYRVQNYEGHDEYLHDGWVDFSDHSLKHETEEELTKQALRCIFRRGHYYVINDGELHPCSRSYWRMSQGIMPRDEKQYINLLDNDLELINEKKQALKKIEDLVALKSCAYCNGVYNGIKRYKPAEQL